MNLQDKSRNLKSIDIFHYRVNTLPSLETIFSPEELENKEFYFYIPKWVINRAKILQKRWVWYSPPRFYSSQSDILAILIHYGSFDCKQSSLDLVGVFASFQWVKDIPQYYDMKRKNGIRSRQSQNSEGRCVVVKQIILDTDGSLQPTLYKTGKNSFIKSENLALYLHKNKLTDNHLEKETTQELKPRTRSTSERLKYRPQLTKNLENKQEGIIYDDRQNSISSRGYEKGKFIRKQKINLQYQNPKNFQKPIFNLIFPKKKTFNQTKLIFNQQTNPLTNHSGDTLKKKKKKIISNFFVNFRENNMNLKNLPFETLQENSSNNFTNQNKILNLKLYKITCPNSTHEKNTLKFEQLPNKKISRKRNFKNNLKENNKKKYRLCLPIKVFSFSNDPW
ncbi:hypothetical protein M0812_24060 [Anaeramoeba flamelloides]|uniref:Uncharacterized protein n=1 Tax=Anaeramoeba flamelloides TaxID=1746091 RepID=A0AAV7YG45_9EUKA|nr:hypothetical protein M0812_24060 [Anaeramoeba flamelloides]